jgi:spore germination cell wall hydrolase CwlJ-like protein
MMQYRAVALGIAFGSLMTATSITQPSPEIIETEVEVVRVMQTTIEVEVPPIENSLYNRRDVLLLAATMWGEARGEGVLAMRAVGHVILNRAESDNASRYGTGLRGVILRPWQFSVWNHGDPNRDRMVHLIHGWQPSGDDGAMWLIARSLARDILEGRSIDPTNGALYYHTNAVSPSWSRGGEISTTIGSHIFYAALIS